MRVELEHERARTAEKVALLEQTEQGFADRFDALAADALRKNNESFLELASGRLGQKEQAVQQLVQPLKDALANVTKGVEEIERSRRQDYGALRTSVQALAHTSDQVRGETARLATALRSSEVRGAWGQMQLRNTVETAGMLAYCDFDEEVHTVSDGRSLRPDLVVRLPGGRRVVVDAKTPLKALLDSLNAPEEQRPAADRRLRPPRPRAREAAEPQELLAAVRRHAGLRRHVPARRGLLPDGDRGRSEPARDRLERAGRPRQPDAADRPPAHGRRGVERGEGGRERARGEPARPGALRAPDAR